MTAIRRRWSSLAWLCTLAFSTSFSCLGPARLVTSPEEAKRVLSDPSWIRHPLNAFLREVFGVENVFTTNDTEIFNASREVVKRGMEKGGLCSAASIAVKSITRGQRQPLSRLTERVVFEVATRAFLGAKHFDGIGIDDMFFDLFNYLWRHRRTTPPADTDKTSALQGKVQAFYRANKAHLDSHGVWGTNLPPALRTPNSSNLLSIIIPIHLNTWVAVQRILVRLLRDEADRQRVQDEIANVNLSCDASLDKFCELDRVICDELRRNPPVKSLERENQETGERVKLSVKDLNNKGAESWEFGSGRGACPARNYACSMIKTTVAYLLPRLSRSWEECQRPEPLAVNVCDALVLFDGDL
ncbi:unnamed protein product [Effrenium voratum]|uniref:Cytochrome P450 n=1 Tax=Effrenium voratum TaxID=2562239 RepID=A0AA36JIL0_9DINO|nr:unnamed protein product [Effrenium voratum]